MTGGGAGGTAQRTLRVMVCPHELVMGGSQLNAIDLAAALRRRGHEVEIFAPTGPILPIVHDRGVPYVAAPARRTGFDFRGARALADEVGRFRPDVVHTFESYPTVASVLASRRQPHRLVVTVMSMSVPDYLPDDVILTVGTGALAIGESRRRGRVEVLEPPIDAVADAPGDRAAARVLLEVPTEALVVAVVGRLSAEHHKARGIAEAIRELSSGEPSRRMILLVAGAGDEQHLVQDAAAEANAAGRGVEVRLLGAVDDPRPVYDAADIIFGMGGSALRAMAHAKPVIVQGREGFWKLATPESIDQFFIEGFFGVGPSGGPGVAQLIDELTADEAGRERLGEFGRRLVLDRYDLPVAAARVEQLYLDELLTARSAPESAAARRRSIRRFLKFRIAVTLPWLQRGVRAVTGRRG